MENVAEITQAETEEKEGVVEGTVPSNGEKTGGTGRNSISTGNATNAAGNATTETGEYLGEYSK